MMGLSSVLVQSTRLGALVGRWRPDPRSCGGLWTFPWSSRPTGLTEPGLIHLTK